MKRIYLIYGCYGVGGAQRRAAILANEFAQRGNKVTVISVNGNNGSIKIDNFYCLSKTVEMVMLPDFITENRNTAIIKQIYRKAEKKEHRLKKAQNILYRFDTINHHINRALRISRKAKALSAYFAVNEPGIVICFGFGIFEQVFCSAKKYHNKIIYAGTNSIQKHRSDKNYQDTLERLKNADALVFQTQEQKAELDIGNGSNIRIIYNPIRENLPLPYSGIRRKVIVNFCALKRHKNLILLIRAFQKLREENPEFADYQLHLYSDKPTAEERQDTDSYRDEIVRFITDHHLESSIMLLPMVPDVHKRIMDCSMFVSSSDYEGISNSMLEAMAIGLPCVCTDCAGGGAREFITDGNNGLLVGCNDADALCAAMKRMLDSDALAAKCGFNAAEIRKTLSAESISDQWLNLMDSV